MEIGEIANEPISSKFFKPIKYAKLKDNLRYCLCNDLFVPPNQQNYMQLVMRENLPQKEEHLADYLAKTIPTVLRHYFFETIDRWGNAIRSGVYDQLYWFDGTYWKEFKVNTELAIILVEATGLPLVYQSTAKLKMIVEAILDHIKEFDEMSTEGYLNLHNGYIHIEKGNVIFHKHTKDIFFKYCLPYSYYAVARCPIFMRYLNRVLPNKEYQDVLQEYCGWTLVNDLKLEKILFLIGEGGNGKSLFLEVLKGVLGKDNISFFELHELVGGTKAENRRYMAFDKLINIGSEVKSTGYIDMSTLKKMISNEEVSIEKKFSDALSVKWRPRLLFAGNDLPSSIEFKEAFLRRFMVIPFDVTITAEERDVHLAQKIVEKESAGVLNWMIKGAQRLIRYKQFTQSEILSQAIGEYRVQYDPLEIFITENGLDNSRSRSTSDGLFLFQKYRWFCQEANIKNIGTLKSFYTHLEKKGFAIARSRPRRYFIEVKDGFNKTFLSKPI